MPELDRQRDKSGQSDLRTFRSVFPNREPAIAFWYFPFDPAAKNGHLKRFRWGRPRLSNRVFPPVFIGSRCAIGRSVVESWLAPPLRLDLVECRRTSF